MVGYVHLSGLDALMTAIAWSLPHMKSRLVSVVSLCLVSLSLVGADGDLGLGRCVPGAALAHRTHRGRGRPRLRQRAAGHAPGGAAEVRRGPLGEGRGQAHHRRRPLHLQRPRHREHGDLPDLSPRDQGQAQEVAGPTVQPGAGPRGAPEPVPRLRRGPGRGGADGQRGRLLAADPGRGHVLPGPAGHGGGALPAERQQLDVRRHRGPGRHRSRSLQREHRLRGGPADLPGQGRPGLRAFP